jgi:hypothetical protein
MVRKLPGDVRCFGQHRQLSGHLGDIPFGSTNEFAQLAGSVVG